MNVRVVALGAGGGMGRYAAKTAAAFDFVHEIVVADLDEARAARVASEWVGEKAKTAKVDITKRGELERLLEGADVVFNTTGPFYKFGPPVLEAAIAAGCHYLDICDDWEPTLEMLAMDGAAREAGITAVLGLGASPGITNLLAVKAAEALDRVSTLITGWGESEESREGLEELKPGTGGSFSAAYDHWLKQASGTIRLLEGGRFVDVPPLREVTISYPGRGDRVAYTIGHPEPVTLPRRFQGLRSSCNVMVMPEEVIALLQWLRQRIDAGKMTIPEAVREVEEAIETLAPHPGSRDSKWDETRKGLAWLARKLVGRRMGPGDAFRFLRAQKKGDIVLPTLFGYAEGEKDGRGARASAELTSLPHGSMGGMTGIPLAVGLHMLGNGFADRHGVFAPEEVIDPDAFFDHLAPLCSPPRKGADDLVMITVAR